MSNPNLPPAFAGPRPDIQTGLPAMRGDEAVWRPFRDDEWDEQVAERFERVVAFPAFRAVMESQAQDPYREGPFDRVWCARERRQPFTKFGLQFDGKTVEASLHHDAGGPQGWQAAVSFALDQLATRVFPEPEPPFLPGGGEQTPEARRAAVAGSFPQFRR